MNPTNPPQPTLSRTPAS